MESLIFALNATMPIVFVVAIGYFLKRIGLMSADFVSQANKLVFRVFLPVMLFLNVYKIEDISSIRGDFIIFTALGVVAIFAIGIPFSILITKRPDRRGVLHQAVFRSNNAIIGVSLATLLAGLEGAIAASILSAVVVPIFNALGVVALSMYSGEGGEGGDNPSGATKGATRVKFPFKKILIGIIKNPLIISIALGFVALGIRAILTALGSDFRISDIGAISKTLDYLSSLATPLALIALGGQFEFSAIGELKKEIIAGTVARIILAPVILIALAALIFGESVTAGMYAALVAVFATPVAVSTVPMSQEMGGDTRLAGQLVIFSTLFSSITVFLFTFVLSLFGCL
jgi:predicted permease